MVTHVDNASRLEILLYLCRTINSCDSIFSILACLNQALHSVLHFEQVYLVLKDPISGQDELHSATESTCIEEAARKFGFPEQLVLYLRQTSTQLGTANFFLKPIAQSPYILIPLATMKRSLGVFIILCPSPAFVTAEDTIFLHELALLIAPFLDHKRNLSSAQNQLRVLLNINNIVTKTSDFQELIHEVAMILRPAGGADSYALVLNDSSSKTFRWVALDLESGSQSKYMGITSPVDYGYPSSTAFITRKPIILDGTQFASLINRRHKEAEAHIWMDEGAHSTIAIPLFAHDKPLGVFNASYNHTYNRDQTNLLLDIGSQLSLAVENLLAGQEISRFTTGSHENVRHLAPALCSTERLPDLIGESRALKEVLAQVEAVAPTDATVLICGETGTGKELIANAIHAFSRRCSRPFVKINCASIPSALFESEFFGHEKGSFTGATAQTVGRLERAHNGTLFLDEIGDMPFELQPKLLRVLQEREFERVGGMRSIRIDIRLIAATNQNLKQLVSDRQFRSDLYYRLNIFPIVIPPLRDRREDIPLLVNHFVQKFAKHMNKTIVSIPSETMSLLERALWPGNVRELAAVIERAVILSTNSVLKIPTLNIEESKSGFSSLQSYEQSSSPCGASLESLEREHILRVLGETKCHISRAAIQLGVKRTTLNYKLQRLGITVPDLKELRRTLRAH